MVSLTDPEENTTYWSYGPLGWVATETICVDSTDLTRTLSYDARGNLVRTVDRNRRVIDYGYDSLSRQTTETWYDNLTDGGAQQNVRKAYLTEYDPSGLQSASGWHDCPAPNRVLQVKWQMPTQKAVRIGFFVLLLAASTLFFGKWFIEGAIGYTRRGVAPGFDKVPLEDQTLPGLSTAGPVRYRLFRHPHGSIHAVVSGSTTVKEMLRFAEEGGLDAIASTDVDRFKQDLVNYVNHQCAENPEMCVGKFSMGDLLIHGKLNDGNVLGAHRACDGAFFLSLSFP